METDTYLKLTDHQGETVHLLLSHLGGGKHALSTSVGSGTSTVIPPEGGAPVNLADGSLVISLNHPAERVILLSGLPVPRTLSVRPGSGDSVTVKFRAHGTDDWTLFGVYTGSTDIVIEAPVGQVSLQRTAGSGNSRAFLQ